MDMPMTDSPEAAESTGAPQADGGYCIEIYVAPDGSMTVSKEPKSPEEAAAAASQGKPVANLDEAMNEVRKLHGGGDDRMSVEQAFGEGFKGSEVGPGMGY